MRGAFEIHNPTIPQVIVPEPGLSRDDNNHGFVERVGVRVLQANRYFVRSEGRPIRITGGAEGRHNYLSVL
jgi:hypothetical protein